MEDELKTIWAKRVAVKCEGIYQSSMAVESIFQHYKRFTGSREFYRMLLKILDANIETLATFSDRLQQQEVNDNKFITNNMNRAKEKSWQVVEDICDHVFHIFKEDWWTYVENKKGAITVDG